MQDDHGGMVNETIEHIRTRRVSYFVVWTSSPRHYTYLKIAKEGFREPFRAEYMDSLASPSKNCEVWAQSI